MKTTVYLSRKLLNQLKVKETESKDLMLTHNLHNIIINGKRVGCSGHIQNVLNNKCVYVSTEKSCYQPLSDKNLVRYAAMASTLPWLAASSCAIEKRLVFLTMKFSIWRMTGAARVSISYINAVGLPFVILRWAIHSSIWMRPKPQQKLK